MGNTSQKLNKIIETKAAIKAALINKNVNVSDDTKFSEYPALIESIEVGGGNGATDDFYNLITNNGTNYKRLFYDKDNIESLDLSGFDTSQVTNMSYMFYNCPKLTSLDLSGFDTSQVTDMSYMFYYCSNLTSLDLSGFDTSQVTNMSYMFGECDSLETLDLSNFDISQATNISAMFYGCFSLHTLRLDNCSGYTVNKIKNMLPENAIEGKTRTIYCKEEAAGTPPTNWVFSYV